MQKATALFQEFTGHAGEHVYTFADEHNAGIVGLRVGPLDYLGVMLNGKPVFIDLRGPGQPDLGASHDGKRLVIAGGDQSAIIAALNKKTGESSKSVDYGKIFAIAYTTTRDNAVEKYVHEFAIPARPLLSARRGGLVVKGGRFQFLDSGINDK